MPKLIKPAAQFASALKPYEWHGLVFQEEPGNKNAKTDCPFCGKEGKLGVTVAEGLWRCVACNYGEDKGKVNRGGNFKDFMRCLWKFGDETTKDYEVLSRERGLVHADTLIHWGVCRSPITNHWLVPGYGTGNLLDNLYRYATAVNSDKFRLTATVGLSHALFGMLQWNPKRPEVWWFEGPWDAMAAWEIVQLIPALKDRINILAAPSCNVWVDWWDQLAADRRNTFFYDSDHPTILRGVQRPGAGWEGMKRVSQHLQRAKDAPSELLCIRWGQDGYNPNLPSGFDVRDLLTQSNSAEDRIKLLEELLAMVHPVPKEWIGDIPRKPKRGEKLELEELPCTKWSDLIAIWHKALELTDGLDRALSVMLSCVASTKAVGDQLWCKIMSPPSTAKSTLAEAICANKKYVHRVNHLTGMYSGWKSDKDGDEDNSLVALLYDKTMVVKDGDTILSMTNKSQILGQLRDLYDRVSSTHYKTGINRSYQGVNITVILCGTGSLRELDTSELGERFIDVVIMEGVDVDIEASIAKRKMTQAFASARLESNGDPHHQNSPEMTEAMRLTAGYVTYLRENAQELLKVVETPQWAGEKCIDYASFVANLRARPSPRQVETVEREMSARLVSQFCRLAMCLAVVLNKPTLDAEVMRRVRQCALDTAKGRTLNIARILYAAGDNGHYAGTIAVQTHETDEKTGYMLRFLQKIGVAEPFHRQQMARTSTRVSWKLTAAFAKLYKRVMEL